MLNPIFHSLDQFLPHCQLCLWFPCAGNCCRCISCCRYRRQDSAAGIVGCRRAWGERGAPSSSRRLTHWPSRKKLWIDHYQIPAWEDRSICIRRPFWVASLVEVPGVPLYMNKLVMLCTPFTACHSKLWRILGGPSWSNGPAEMQILSSNCQIYYTNLDAWFVYGSRDVCQTLFLIMVGWSELTNCRQLVASQVGSLCLAEIRDFSFIYKIFCFGRRNKLYCIDCRLLRHAIVF